MNTSYQPVALVTGSARRIGATIVRTLHQHGYRVLIHYHHSSADAEALAIELNQQKNDTACVLHADLNQHEDVIRLAKQALEPWQRIDLLVNNASQFYATPLGDIQPQHWDDLMASNLKAPLFLSQALAPALRDSVGCIINITDIFSTEPLTDYSVYSAAKAGLAMLTKSLALELAPTVRVNAIAPGAILWPEENNNSLFTDQQALTNKIPLKRLGEPDDIAAAVLFLATQASYMTGQTLRIDGGYP